jgi:hypothetical protein
MGRMVDGCHPACPTWFPLFLGVCLATGCKRVDVEALHRSVDPDVRTVFQLLHGGLLHGELVEGKGASQAKEVLASILKRDPTNPIALSYLANELTADNRYDEAIAHLRSGREKAEAAKEVPNCRSKESADRWKHFGELGCISYIHHGWLDVNAFWICPPGPPGTREWQMNVEALEYDIVSVAIAKAGTIDGPSHGMCP